METKQGMSTASKIFICATLAFLTIHADSYARSDASARREIAYRASLGRAEDISMLVRQGASPDEINEDGVPLIALAAKRKDKEALTVLKTLLELGADINAKDTMGQTALFYAAKDGNTENVKFLLDNNINYYALDNNGDLARNIAFREGHNNIVQMLDGFVNEQSVKVNKQYEAANEAMAKRFEEQKAQMAQQSALLEQQAELARKQAELLRLENEKKRLLEEALSSDEAARKKAEEALKASINEEERAELAKAQSEAEAQKQEEAKLAAEEQARKAEMEAEAKAIAELEAQKKAEQEAEEAKLKREEMARKKEERRLKLEEEKLLLQEQFRLEQEAKAKQRDEELKKREAEIEKKKLLYAEQEKQIKEKEIRDQQNLEDWSQDLVSHSCSFQYWYYCRETEQPTDFTPEEMDTAIESHRDAIIELTSKIDDLNPQPTNYAKKLSEKAKRRIFNKLDGIPSRSMRKQQGVGSMSDMNKRCGEITRLWQVVLEDVAEDEGDKKGNSKQVGVGAGIGNVSKRQSVNSQGNSRKRDQEETVDSDGGVMTTRPASKKQRSVKFK